MSIDNPGGGLAQDPVPVAGQQTGSNLPDTANLFLVTCQGGRVLMMAPRPSMSRKEALNLAGWLFVMIDMMEPGRNTVQDLRLMVEAIENT